MSPSTNEENGKSQTGNLGRDFTGDGMRNNARLRGGGRGAGPGGQCLCTNCGTVVAHKQGIPCIEETCPNCGASMSRE